MKKSIRIWNDTAIRENHLYDIGNRERNRTIRIMTGKGIETYRNH